MTTNDLGAAGEFPRTFCASTRWWRTGNGAR